MSTGGAPSAFRGTKRIKLSVPDDGTAPAHELSPSSRASVRSIAYSERERAQLPRSQSQTSIPVRALMSPRPPS